MGKKAKVGKARQDKFYKLAKETGYRSRAAFKLIQLNRRFGFLQSSQVCIDLCAAPGGWMQVAKKTMPVSSIVIGIDLYGIKPIPGCISLIEDITTDKCKTSLSRELKTWKADVVLHDGAPNVGKNWLYDAYQQICLTLNAVKLATQFLRSGGWFVTKVFRSKDYNALLWVLKQLFKKVHATKPSASRKESAEIFIVCQGYIAPDKIDPKFLDAKYVFEELELEPTKPINFMHPENQKKIKAEGYSEQDLMLRNRLPVSQFIQSDNEIAVLQGISSIIFDNNEVENHPRTTFEIKECCKDIKVLGRKDLRSLFKWRLQMKEDFYKTEPVAEIEEEIVKTKPLTVEEEEDLEFQTMEKHISEMELSEQKELKRKKKKTNKERAKLNEKLNLKMVLKYDEGPREEADDMFDFNDIGGLASLDILADQAPDQLADSDPEVDTFTPKFKRYDKNKMNLDDDGLVNDGDDDDDELDENKVDTDDSDMEQTGLGFSDSDNDDKSNKKIVKRELKMKGKPDRNPLITDLDHRDKDTKRNHRVQLWFEKDKLKDVGNDDADEDVDLDKLTSDYKKRGVEVLGEAKKEGVLFMGKKKLRRSKHGGDQGHKSSSDDSSDSEDEAYMVETERTVTNAGDKDGFEVVKEKQIKYKLNDKELALGALMVQSKKIKRDLMDGAWNRYAFNDDNLPDWFVKDEALHMVADDPIPPLLLEEYRNKVKELNIRPLKKVIEAKARKKRRTMKRFEKAKKKAEAILENADSSTQEKTRQLKKIYKTAEGKKKKEVTYVVAKKANAAKRMKRPAGLKGRYKVVDNRQKKDTRAKVAKGKRKGGKGGKR